MKEINLTKGFVARVDDGDYEALSRHKWTAVVTGKNIKRTYAYRRVGWSNETRRYAGAIYMHREIMGAGAGFDVDHINGDTLNNSRSNLRIATRSQNLANNRRNLGKVEYRGVTLTNSGERAPYKAMFRNRVLGTFNDPVMAAKAYDAAALQEFGEFAKLNFPIVAQ